MIRRIEVRFAMPVELTSEEMQIIDTIANDAARRTETPEIVHWAAGCGSKPNWSKTDCAIFGYEPTEDSPDSGEPTFNDEIFCVETFARERYETEKFEPEKNRRSHADQFHFLTRQLALYRKALVISACDRSPERSVLKPEELAEEYLAEAKESVK